MKIYNHNILILDDCEIAITFWQKLFGKIFMNKTILIENCNSIHTFFLKENIDVIFLDKNKKVLKLYENLAKNKIILPVKYAKYVLEINAGFLKSDKIKENDILVFKK